MYIYTKLKEVFFCCLLVLILASCSATQISTDKLTDCEIGEVCNLTGLLTIRVSSIGAVGVLNDGDNCISIALPMSLVEKKKRWDGKQVVVQGEIHSNSSAHGVVSYTLKDREVLVGACPTDKILYLNKIDKI